MAASNEKTKLRYTQKEWDYIEGGIARAIYEAREAVQRRLGGGFSVPYPPTDEATAKALEEFFMELGETLDEADREMYRLLEDNAETVE